MRVLVVFLLVSCTSSPAPIFIPEPITDEDPYSALARAVRARNPDDMLSSIATIRALPPPPDVLPHLDELETHAPDPYIDPRPVSRIVALGQRASRSTFYVLYHWLHDWEIERERPFVRALAATLRSRGYDVVIDEDTTPTEWYSYVSRRDMAGILWRSEGWFEHKPGTPHSHVTTRIWTTTFGSPRHRIFSDDWAATLPEGLSFAAIASCGTAGPYLEDEVDALEDLPDPDTLTFNTFHTDLHDRTLFLRTYRGLLATSGYSLDDLSWTLATTLPPDRSDLSTLPPTGRQEMIDLLSDPSHPFDLERTMAADPLTWVPLLIDALPSTPAANTLNHISGAFTGTPESFTTAAEWQAWWDSLTDLRAEAEHIAAHAPDEADVWIALSTAFTAHTGHYRAQPTQGLDLEEFCHERFLRCIVSDLSPWSGTDTLTRTSTTFCSDPLPTPLTLTFDPSTSTLDHDLESVIDATPPADIMDRCTSLD